MFLGQGFAKTSLGSKANKLWERLGLGCACQLPVGRGMSRVQGPARALLLLLGGWKC